MNQHSIPPEIVCVSVCNVFEGWNAHLDRVRLKGSLYDCYFFVTGGGLWFSVVFLFPVFFKRTTCTPNAWVPF